MFFPTLHDAMLYVINKQKVEQKKDSMVRKTYIQVQDQIIYWTETQSVSPIINTLLLF